MSAPTARGFNLAKFKDGNGEACSIQESSAAERPMIWLGNEHANPQHFPGDGTGWHAYTLPANVQVNTRMHLTQENVAALLPLLHRFVETGGLSVPVESRGANGG